MTIKFYKLLIFLTERIILLVGKYFFEGVI